MNTTMRMNAKTQTRQTTGGSMMKKIVCISIVSIIMYVHSVCAGFTEAQVPKKINYQGYLTDTSGNLINDTLQITFAIYDAATGGSALWSETQTVTVNDGRYSVSLGAVNPITLTEAKPYWLGVKIGSDPEMTPRKEMTGTIYDVVQGSNSGGTDLWSESQGNIYRENGNVGLGTATPARFLRNCRETAHLKSGWSAGADVFGKLGRRLIS